MAAYLLHQQFVKASSNDETNAAVLDKTNTTLKSIFHEFDSLGTVFFSYEYD